MDTTKPQLGTTEETNRLLGGNYFDAASGSQLKPFTPTSITQASLTPSSPITVTSPVPSTAAAGMSGHTDQTVINGQSALDKQLADKVAADEAAKADSKSALSSIMDRITGVQSSRATEETNAHIPELSKLANDSFTALQASKRAQQNEVKAMQENHTGMSASALAGEVNRINSKYANEQADLSISYDVANRNYANVQATVDRKIQLQLEPLQTQLQYQTTFYNDNKEALSKSEQNQLQVLIDKNKTAISNKSDVGSVINDLLKANPTAATPELIKELTDNATDKLSANAILAKHGVSLQAQKYAPLPFGSTTVYNPLTGETKTVNSSGSTVADRNNNPGNLKGLDGQFQTFSTPQEGQQALIQDLTAKMTGATSTGLTSKSTLLDFANTYAPSSDNNNPAQYAKNLAAQLGVPVTTPIGSLLPRANEFAAAVAKNEGGTFVDPQLPLMITKNYGVALNAEQSQAFQKIPEADKRIVAGILSGKRLVSGLTTRNGYNQTILDYAQSVDPTFDSVSVGAGQKFQQNPETQKFIANANTASNTVDKIIELSNKVDRGSIQVLNNGVLKLKQGVSDKNATELVTLSGILADELGKILGSGQGSDFTIQLGQSLVNPNLSKEAFAAQANLLKDRIGNKLDEYNKQGQGTVGNTPSSSAVFDNLFKQYGGQ